MNTTFILNRLNVYGRLIRIEMPVGATLLLWPTWIALWIAANGNPLWHWVVIFGIAPFLMHSAGCAINDYLDRNFDAQVLRTKNRPFPAGEIQAYEAWGIAILCGVLGILCLIPMPPLAWKVAVVAAFLLLTYPLTKRFFPVPQLYLAIAYSFGIPMAFAAQSNSLPWIVVLLMLANIPWVVAFDTIYAISDKPDDINIGIQTSALTFGDYDVVWVMALHGLHAILMAAVGWVLHAHIVFWLFWGIAIFLQAIQYFRIKNRDREACFQTFLFNNNVGLCMFIAILSHYAAI